MPLLGTMNFSFFLIQRLITDLKILHIFIRTTEERPSNVLPAQGTT